MPTRSRLAIAFITACVAATGVYALLRLGQWLLFPEANPALILYSDHAAYFWRAWTSGYTGVLIGFIAWLRAERVAPRLPAALSVVAMALLIQSLFIP